MHCKTTYNLTKILLFKREKKRNKDMCVHVSFKVNLWYDCLFAVSFELAPVCEHHF